jgi:alpha-galactosidase
MIKVLDKHFIIDTKSLTYIMHVNSVGYLIHDYFGDHIEVKDVTALGLKEGFAKGTSVVVDEDIDPNFSANNQLLEYSFTQKGDYREPAIILRNNSRGYTFDFRYHEYKIIKPQDIEILPMPHDLDDELIIVLKEANLDFGDVTTLTEVSIPEKKKKLTLVSEKIIKKVESFPPIVHIM